MNPTNQLSSYDSHVIAQANSGYFCLPMGCNPTEIELNQVFGKKENRGEECSKQFTSNHTAATEALKPEFGAKHFFKGVRMARKVMLVTQITPKFKNYFVAT